MADLLTESAERLFAAHCDVAVVQAAEVGVWPASLWDAVAEAGFCHAMTPEDAGGYGATVQEAMSILRAAAAYAAPVPLAETMVAAMLLARVGLAVPPGPLTFAPVRRGDRLTARRHAGGWRIQGTARRVPWGRVAGLVVLADGPEGPVIAALPPASTVRLGSNLANEPRDTVTLDEIVADENVAPAPIDAAWLRLAGAALRANQIAGALSRALSMTTDYAKTRHQFGRSIGKFQAIQHGMAVFAGQAAAGQAAADMAADAMADGMDLMTIAAAKARAGEAASIAAGIAHQTHGAIGFTREYRLHPLTRRLWSWRDEFGNEAEWNLVIGRIACAAGADGLWPLIAANPDCGGPTP